MPTTSALTTGDRPAFRVARGASISSIIAVGVLGAQDGLDAERGRGARGDAGELRWLRLAAAAAPAPAARPAARHTGRALERRGRARRGPANAIYGAAKAGFDALAQGLADATAGTGVRVLVVRPGFVTTRMTAGLKPAPLATTPEAVADATVRALAGRAHTVWVPAHTAADVRRAAPPTPPDLPQTAAMRRRALLDRRRNRAAGGARRADHLARRRGRRDRRAVRAGHLRDQLCARVPAYRFTPDASAEAPEPRGMTARGRRTESPAAGRSPAGLLRRV